MVFVTLNSTPDQAIFIPGEFAKCRAFLLLTSINIISSLKTKEKVKLKKTIMATS